MRNFFTKALLFFTCCFMIFFACRAEAAPREFFNRIIFFGDSLTDDGNLYQSSLHLIPKSPPYFEGRFSNGITWAEHVAKYYKKNYAVDSENFAVGGETVVFHNPLNGFLPLVFSQSINNYLLKNLLNDKSHTLFMIWVGSNDYLFGADNAEEITNNVLDEIGRNIQALINKGGKNFILINLPDLGDTPEGKSSSLLHDNLHDLSLMHNQKLLALTTQLQLKNPAIHLHIFNTFALFDDLLNHLPFYNKKYHTHLSQYFVPCWKGGFTFKNGTFTVVDTQQLAEMTAHATSLAVAYDIGKRYENGETPCANPDDYIFWDSLHPSEVVHHIFAETMQEYINNFFTPVKVH